MSRSHLTISISGVNKKSSTVSTGVTPLNIKLKDYLSPIINFKDVIITSICKKLPCFDIPLVHKNWDKISDLKLTNLNFGKANV